MTARKPAKITEAEFQRQVQQLAKACGFLSCHFRPAINRRGVWQTPIQGDAGFPDTVLVHPVRRLLIVWELKVNNRKLTSEQERWIKALQSAGIQAAVVTPDDWPMIERELMNP